MSADDLALERGQRVGQLSALLEAVQGQQAPMDVLAHLLRIQAMLQRELLLVESWCVLLAKCLRWSYAQHLTLSQRATIVHSSRLLN